MEMRLYSELQKVKRTAYWKISLIMPILGGLIFFVYFLLYRSVPESKKMKLMFELIAVVFPVLISIVVAINFQLESSAGNMQRLLIQNKKVLAFSSKMFFIIFSGFVSCLILVSVFALGVIVFNIEIANLFLYFKIALVLFLSNIIIYLIHIFIQLKFSTGISILLSVIEMLLAIMFSNVNLNNELRYLPISWGVDNVKSILNLNYALLQKEMLIQIVIILVSFILSNLWFLNFENKSE